MPVLLNGHLFFNGAAIATLRSTIALLLGFHYRLVLPSYRNALYKTNDFGIMNQCEEAVPQHIYCPDRKTIFRSYKINS